MTENKSNYIDNLLQQALSDNETVIDLSIRFNEKIEEYDLTQRKVIDLLNIDQRTLEDIISGNAKQPSLINILKLAYFLELDIKDILPAIIKNLSQENITSISRAKQAAFIAKNFDIKKLYKTGFFLDLNDIDYLTKRVLTFFDFDNLFDFENKLSTPLFSKSKRKHSDKMKDFWVKSAYRCFESINNPNEYDRESLKDIITKSRPYCQDVEDGLLTVCRALYNVGVTVIVQNHLLNTQLRGGTFIINNKPCIVLTDLFKRYTTIWETLIHELHHVLYDLETIKSTKYHLSGDDDLFLIEDKANDFSREYFCGFDDYSKIKEHINNPFLVSRFAKELEVEPSFIYSSYRYFQKELHNKNYYGAFNEHFPDYYLSIKNLTPINWKENSITEAAENFKSILEINS